MRILLNTLFICTFLLTGCASSEPNVTLNRNNVYLVVKTENFTNTMLQGTPRYYPDLNLCVITLKKYPYCLAHEVRHCLEGAWHKDLPSTQDC